MKRKNVSLDLGGRWANAFERKAAKRRQRKEAVQVPASIKTEATV
jgi:hypothetical protein